KRIDFFQCVFYCFKIGCIFIGFYLFVFIISDLHDFKTKIIFYLIIIYLIQKILLLYLINALVLKNEIKKSLFLPKLHFIDKLFPLAFLLLFETLSTSNTTVFSICRRGRFC